jgi:hypothetical protein
MGKNSQAQVSTSTTLCCIDPDEPHREHLHRVHTDPILCRRCQLLFKTKKDLTEHIRKQSPCEMQPQLVKWISPEEIKSLKDHERAPKGQSKGERWEYIYGILFPEELNIPSPCKSPMILFHEVISRTALTVISDYYNLDHTALKQYLQNNLGRRIEKVIEARPDKQMPPIQESPEIACECLAQLFREWERPGSGIGQGTKGESSTQTLKTDDATGQVSHGEPSLLEPKSWDELPSISNTEAVPSIFANAFGGPSQFQDNGGGPSRATTDSGYNSLYLNSDITLETPTLLLDTDTDTENARSLQQELEDAWSLGLHRPDF